jgi:hypothetical protein
MIMGNYLMAESVLATAMATRTQSVGVDHVTIIPENFDAEAAGDDEESGTHH